MHLRSLALATAISLVVPAAMLTFTPVTLAAAADTEDILVLDDGRELHGRIVSDDGHDVVFELIDRQLNLKTTLTLSHDRIVEIRKGVAVKGAPAEKPAKPAKPEAAPKPAAPAAEAPADEAASEPATTADARLPRIYVVPMKGQMGTDIHPEIYREVVNDIKKEKPTLVVFEMLSTDVDDALQPHNRGPEEGLLAFDEYRDLVNMLKDDLRDVPQVMWVRDAAGIASMIALAWKDLYMTSSARLAGLDRVVIDSGSQKWTDEDIRAKMTAAYVAYANGFLEYGGYPLELGKAMMLPKFELSASFEGRKVVWRLDADGQFIVDKSGEDVVGFRARTAENLCISKGTVDNIDDLLFLLGYREYTLIGEQGKKLVDDYRKSWRGALKDTFDWWQEYEQFMGWASGTDALKYLGQAKQRLSQIINAMNRYKPIEIRWRTERGVQKLDLIVQEEQLKEQIQAMKKGGRGTGGGSGPGRRGGGGASPG